jgi:protein-arginine kinase activator protein McsA
MTEKKLIKKIEDLLESKQQALVDMKYELAAELRDKIRKCTALLEDKMNE